MKAGINCSPHGITAPSNIQRRARISMQFELTTEARHESKDDTESNTDVPIAFSDFEMKVFVVTIILF